jgi:ubiquitin-conjugating enzyme E2 Z
MATTPSALAIKRVVSDMKDLNRDPLEQEGIYHYYDDSNIMEARIMIIGPEDTPYENGFYFFQFKFPNNYPFEPPKVSFHTLDGNVRFNPNLYTNGKVCLSIINTWDGPKWTSCQTIRSVLISLRGLVLGVKNPLHNEPGFENVLDGRSVNYNDIVLYENYRVAVVKMINDTPDKFDVFKQQMITYVKSKYTWYNERLTSLSKFDKTKVTDIVYNMSVTRNYSSILKEINDIMKKNGYVPPNTKVLLTEDDYNSEGEPESASKKKQPKTTLTKKSVPTVPTTTVPTTTVPTIVKTIESTDTDQDDEKKKGSRKAPSKSAKDFDNGYETVSENDNRTYVVKTIGEGTDRVFKRWVLKK